MTKLMISKLGTTISCETEEPTDLTLLEAAAFRMYERMDKQQGFWNSYKPHFLSRGFWNSFKPHFLSQKTKK